MIKIWNTFCFLPRRGARSAIFLVSCFFRSQQLRACRFHPTCSEYSAEAFKHFGFFYAFFLMINRILKCHPLSAGGWDPLPQVNGEPIP